MQMSGSLKEDWTVKNWGYYDDFMMIFVTGFVRWLNGLETEVDVMQFDRVLEAAEPNADFTMLLHFMYDVGLPYIGLRQLMRQTSTPQMRAQG